MLVKQVERLPSDNIVDDSLNELNETVIVTLSNPSNATLGSDSVHTYTINDNDTPPVVDFNDLPAQMEMNLYLPKPSRLICLRTECYS